MENQSKTPITDQLIMDANDTLTFYNSFTEVSEEVFESVHQHLIKMAHIEQLALMNCNLNRIADQLEGIRIEITYK
jgi:hypothetical protein